MIQTETKTIGQAIQEVITLATKKQKPQLFSLTDIIPSTDPYSFFHQAKQLEGDRVFWSSTAEDFFLVGAGETNVLEANTNRFDQIEQQWKSILMDACIFNPYRLPGTGPIALGGFTFDPQKEKNGLWENFHENQFRVPAYLLTIYGGTCYLTINMIVCPQDHPKQIEFEIEQNKKELLTTAELPNRPTINQKKEIAPLHWKQLVQQATDVIKQEEIDKIVLAREMRVTFDDDVHLSAILAQLSQMQTNSYVFAFENGQDCFLGATPERLVSVQNQHLLSACLAGTAPRGDTEQQDYQIGQQLLHDSKNRKEHDFVVQMIRDAVTVCSDQVTIPSEPILYPLKHLQHLYTPVKAKLKHNFSIIDVIKRLHPTPALGGVPREKSLEFIRQYEKLERGWYGAPIGWIDAHFNGEFAVAIRSALIQEKEASLFAGCGVVKDSDPEEEYQETTIKFAPMLSVLGGES